MTREAKIGLLISLAIIILIGLVVGEHLSATDPSDQGADRKISSFDQPDDAGVPTRDTARTPSDDGDPQPDPALMEPSEIDRESPQRNTSRGPIRAGNVASASGERAAPTPDPVPRANVAAQTPVPGEEMDPLEWARQEMARAEQQLKETQPDPTERLAKANAPMPLPFEVTPPQPERQRTERSLPFPAYRVAPQAEPARPSPTPAPTPPGTGTIHVVKDDESLWDLAARYYGKGHLWPAIQKANRNVLGETDWIRPGQKLVIPPKSEVERASASPSQSRNELPQPAPADAPSGSRRSTSANEVIVREGDSLSRLAERHLGSSRHWWALYQANRDQLPDPDTIRPGMKLKLPRLDATSAPASRDSQRTTQTPRSNQYVVREGDSLWLIAEKKLGSGKRWWDLYQANRDAIPDPDTLRVGLVLTMP